jgi:raffinose/stachyose/melibiose transport system permease protein
MTRGAKSSSIYSYWFLVPGGLVFTVFFVVPTLASFVLSFTNWGSFQSDVFGVRYVGLRNFRRIFDDPSLNIAFKNTFLFAIVTTFLKCVIGLLLALLVNAKLRIRGYLRTIFFFPCVLNSVAVGLLFLAIYDPTYGLLNTILGAVGLGALKHDWLGNLTIVMYSVSLAEVWKWSGYTMVILLAGLTSIPEDFLEAALIDGCTKLQRFRYITLPLLRGSMNIAILLGIISGLKVFDIVFAITGGGPGFASETFNTLVYQTFSEGFYSLSTAEGVMLFVVVAVVVFPLSWLLSRREAVL